MSIRIDTSDKKGTTFHINKRIWYVKSRDVGIRRRNLFDIYSCSKEG